MPDIEELEGGEPWECTRCHRTFIPTWDNEIEEELNIPGMAIDDDYYCDECCEQMPGDYVEDLLHGDAPVSLRKINTKTIEEICKTDPLLAESVRRARKG